MVDSYYDNKYQENTYSVWILLKYIISLQRFPSTDHWIIWDFFAPLPTSYLGSCCRAIWPASNSGGGLCPNTTSDKFSLKNKVILYIADILIFCLFYEKKCIMRKNHDFCSQKSKIP